MAFAPTPLSFHPLMVDLDWSHHHHHHHHLAAAAAAAAAEDRRQEWEYTQHHLMHLRQQQQKQQAAERRHLVEAYAAAKELERRQLLLEQEQRRRQAQLQAQAQAQLQYEYQQQQQQERQRAARRRRQQQQQQQRAFARQSAEWRRLSHVLDSLAAPDTVIRVPHHCTLDDDEVKEQQQPIVVVPSSPAEMFFQLYGEPDHQRDETDEEVVLKHKQPSLHSAAVAADDDPEEVDLAAAAFAAAAAEKEEEEEEDTTTSSDDDEDSSSEADSVDSDMAETAASTPGNDAEARTAAPAALDALTKLAQDFTARRRAFVTPASLSFQPAPASTPSSSCRSPTPPLAFESNNTPFLRYEDFLVSLLSRIDAVESHGIEEVKTARKNLVMEVEQELARLDDLKDQAWERLSASLSSSSSEEEEETSSASEASSDEDEDSEMMTSEAVEGPSLSDETTASPSSTLDNVFDSDDEEDAAEVQHVKVPFAPGPRPSSRVANRPKVHFARHSSDADRAASPAMSDATAAEDDAAEEEVADIILAAQRLGEQVTQLEEAERDQQEMRDLIDSDSTVDSDSEEVDGGEEMFVVYL